jgi:galactokinase
MINPLENLFTSRFATTPMVVRAPGRINMIGEHTDYNNGFVMPAAIDKAVSLYIGSSGNAACSVIASDLQEERHFTLGELRPSDDWATYIQGVFAGFQQRGFAPQGINALFSSTIPVGAGLSSSAALCCAFAYAINELNDFQLDRLALAKIAQYAEHNYAGVKCGIMDQYASLFGKKNAVILLDCKSLQHEYFPLALTDHTLLLIDTKVKHSLASSAYNKRRESCEEGVAIIQQEHKQVKSLREVSCTLLESYKVQLPEETYRRCFFIVEEIERTQQAAQYLKENKLMEFGALMYKTHEGLSKVYEVSCVESDFLVAAAKEHALTGARMMGGGFGGCTLNLIQKEKLNDFKTSVKAQYTKQFGVEPAFYEVSLEDGTAFIAKE